MSIVTDKRTAREKVVPTLEPKTPFYISRDFAFLWGGQAISNFGDLIFDTTLTLWIATVIANGQVWAPIAAGGALLCISIPTFFAGPLAGVFVDRWDKQRVMVRMDLLRAVFVALLVLVALPLPFLSGGLLPVAIQLGMVYFVLVLTTICSLFFTPARTSIVRDVVDEKHFERASALGLLTQNLSRIIGPALAAPVLFLFGVQWALLINALSFLVSALAVRSVRLITTGEREQKAGQQTGFWKEFKEGLLFFIKSPVLMVILTALLFVTIGSEAEQALGVFFMLDNLHVPTYLYGIIGTVGGVGGILGALAATPIVKKLGTMRSFWLSVTGFGLVLLLFSRMTWFIPALVLIFVAGLPIAAANIAVGPMFLRSTPRQLLGRVSAVLNTSLSVVSILAVSVISTLASVLHTLHASLFGLWFGPYDTIFSISGLLIMLVGLGIGLRQRSISPVQTQSLEEKGEQKEER